ncbi:hypothetical protein ACJX0J_025024, partial [Zea mays]
VLVPGQTTDGAPFHHHVAYMQWLQWALPIFWTMAWLPLFVFSDSLRLYRRILTSLIKTRMFIWAGMSADYSLGFCMLKDRESTFKIYNFYYISKYKLYKLSS